MQAKSVEKLVARAVEIEMVSAQDAGALGFMARAMIQATLPHREVQGTYFERRNGAYTLSMLASPKIGLPYGSVPRLLLAWVTTEAVKTKSRELELGESMSAFMSELGLTPTGGANGSITRLKDQTRRLFAATVLASYEDGHHVEDMGYRLADKSALWWNPKSPEQTGLWRSTVTLSEHFFNEVIERPVPIDLRAIRALKKSPMALDIYTWLTYRMSYLRRPVVIPWPEVAMMFGSDYKHLKHFKQAFNEELRRVTCVYSKVRAESTDEGLSVKPSSTHIPKSTPPSI